MVQCSFKLKHCFFYQHGIYTILFIVLLYDTAHMGYFFNKTFVDISAVHILLITSTDHMLFMKHLTSHGELADATRGRLALSKEAHIFVCLELRLRTCSV